MNTTNECQDLHSLESRNSIQLVLFQRFFSFHPVKRSVSKMEVLRTFFHCLLSTYLSVCLPVDYSSSTGDDASLLCHTLCSTTIVSPSNKSIKHRNEEKDGLKINGLVVGRHRWLEETLRVDGQHLMCVLILFPSVFKWAMTTSQTWLHRLQTMSTQW